MDVINIPHVVTACCVLHNICEMFNDSMPESWFNTETEMDQPPTAMLLPQRTVYLKLMQR